MPERSQSCKQDSEAMLKALIIALPSAALTSSAKHLPDFIQSRTRMSTLSTTSQSIDNVCNGIEERRTDTNIIRFFRDFRKFRDITRALLSDCIRHTTSAHHQSTSMGLWRRGARGCCWLLACPGSPRSCILSRTKNHEKLSLISRR
jgi:hypothetical protein